VKASGHDLLMPTRVKDMMAEARQLLERFKSG